jgi:hypothetical protein
MFSCCRKSTVVPPTNTAVIEVRARQEQNQQTGISDKLDAREPESVAQKGLTTKGGPALSLPRPLQTKLPGAGASQGLACIFPK